MNWEDPIVTEVRRIREDLSAKFNFDVSAIFADIRSRQASAGDRLIRLKVGRKAELADAREAAVASETVAEQQRRPRDPCRSARQTSPLRVPAERRCVFGRSESWVHILRVQSRQ